MWSNLDQPLWLNLYDISHVFMSGEDQFVVDDTLWLRFKQHATRVDLHILTKLDSFVGTTLLELGTVVKVASSDALSNVGGLIV